MHRGPKSLGICLGIFFAAFLLLPALAQQVSGPKYAGQPFVIEQKLTDVTFHNDGTGQMSVNVRIRVQTSAGVQQLGLLSFYYAADNESVEVPLIRVQQADGTVVLSGPDDIHDVPAPITNDAPLFSDLRMKRVTVRGLAPGALLQYRVLYHIHKAEIPGQFWYQHDFIRKAIVLDEEVKISVPKRRKLIVKSADLKPKITVNGGQRIYLWKSANLKIQKAPAGQPLPPYSVELTTFQNWAAVGRWWASLANPESVPDTATKAKAAELTRGATTEQEKLRAIYGYVSTQFRYIGVSFGIGRYRPHAADVVLQNGFGDCKDKDTLLVSLLAAVDIPAYPALVDISRKIDPGVPSPGQFDHVITVVPQNGKRIWLDTTAEVAPFGLLIHGLRNRLALVMPTGQPATLVHTPAEPPFPSLETFRVKAKLDSQGTLTAKFHVTMRGDSEVLYRAAFLSLSPAQQLRFVQSVSRLLGYGGTVSNVVSSSPDDLEKPFSFTYDYTRKGYSDWSEHQITPPLPLFLLPDAKKASTGTSLGKVDYYAEVQLPKGYNPTLPKPILLKGSFATYQSSYSFKDGILIADRDLKTLTDKLPAASLDAYRKFRSAIQTDEDTYIQLTSASSENQEKVQALFQQALEAFRAHSPDRKSLFEHVLKLDPNHPYAWLYISGIDMEAGQMDDALAALGKELSAHPKEGKAYEYGGNLEAMLHDYDKALVDYKKAAQLAPNDAHAHTMYGALLGALGHNNQAAVELAHAAALDPQNVAVQLVLAKTYLRLGKFSQALAGFAQASKINPTPAMWGYVASKLAEADKELGPASHYAEMAVTAEEQDTAHLNLDTLSISDLQAMSKLARYWDTLGWVDYLQGNLGPAQKYLRASWSLAYLPLAGYHLGELYEKLGRKRAAVRIYAMAKANADSSAELLRGIPEPGFAHPLSGPLSENLNLKDQLKWKLRALLGDADRVDAAVTADAGRLTQLRTVKLPLLLNKVSTADFYVLLLPGAHVSAVRYIGGNPALRSAKNVLAAAKFPELFPDNGPTRIVRRVLLSCDPTMRGCDAVLYPPDTIHSVN